MYMLVPVSDRDALHRACRVIWELFDSEPKAARALGITQPHFHRLRTGRIGRRIQQTFKNRLWGVVAASDKRRSMQLVSLLRRAFGEELGAVLAHRERQMTRRYLGPARAYHLAGEVGRVGRVVEAELHRRGYGSFIRSYRNRARAKRSPAQIDLGVRRALEPLAAGALTGGLEPTIARLESAGKLKSYLNAAFGAELILIDPALGDVSPTALPRRGPRSIPRVFVALAGKLLDDLERKAKKKRKH